VQFCQLIVFGFLSDDFSYHSYALKQISEAMDIRTRQGLLSALVGKVGKRMDALLIPLELLCCVSRTEFSDKKAYIRWQKRQVSSSPFSVTLFLCHISSLLRKIWSGCDVYT
jgi:hypothetical protein